MTRIMTQYAPSAFGEVDFRQHAADPAASQLFDDRDVGGHHAALTLEEPALRGIETIPSSGRHGNDAAGCRREFHDVGGEPGHLAHRYLMYLMYVLSHYIHPGISF